MIKPIDFIISSLVVPVLFVLALGPVINCGDSAPHKDSRSKQQEDAIDVSCVEPFSNNIEATAETKERSGVGFYDVQFYDEKLVISAFSENESTGTASFIAAQPNGSSNLFEYKSASGSKFSAKSNAYYLGDDRARIEINFYDERGLVFQFWTKLHAASLSAEDVSLEEMYLVVPAVNGQNVEGGTLSSTPTGKMNILMIYDGESTVEDGISELFIQQSGIHDFIFNGAFAEFISNFSDQMLLEQFNNLATNCRPQQKKTRKEGLETRPFLQQSNECPDRVAYTNLKLSKSAADTNFNSFGLLGGVVTGLGSLLLGYGVPGLFVAGVFTVSTGPLLAVFAGAALVVVGLAYVTYALGQNRRSGDLEKEIIIQEHLGCSAGGEPYFHTLGGLAYPFQAPGQFVLLERPSDLRFALQIHQKTEYFETCSPGALIKTAALQLGRHRVVFDSGGGDVITVDGISREFNRQAIELDGGVIHEIGTGEYRVEWDSGERADISVYVDHLDLQIEVVDEYMSEYRGLLGQHATAEDGALQLRDARVLDGPVAWETLHGSFADSWRVRADESLFNDMEVDTSSLPMPLPLRLEEIGTLAQAQAIRACTQAGIVDGNLMHHCVLDVGCSGDVTYAQSYARLPAPKRVLPLDLRRVTQSSTIDLSHTTMANLDRPQLDDLRTVRMPATDSCGGGGMGDSVGDPHLRALDGLAYDLQAVGEFVLVEAFAGKPLQIQVRQQREPSSRCANVSYNTAVATRLGGYRVTVDSRRAKPLWINGAPSDVPAGFLPLENGDGIFEVSAGHYRFRWADNSLLDIKISHGHLALATLLPDTCLGQVHGLLGRYNGDLSDDLSLRDGTILSQPVKWFDLYEQFAQSWRIAPEESLFDYEAGESTETFSDESAPSQPTTLDDLPDDGRAVARQTCEDAGITDAGLLDDCTMDVYCTGEDSYADVHARRAPADAQVDLLMPIFLDGWLQQGESANGN